MYFFVIRSIRSGLHLFGGVPKNKLELQEDVILDLIFIAFLILLSQLFGIMEAWIAVPCAEILTLVLCMFLHKKYFNSNGSTNKRVHLILMHPF